MSFRVLGTGMYVPPRVVTNDDLSQFLGPKDDGITQGAGVRKPKISTNKTAGVLGARAAMAALKKGGVGGGEKDLVLVVPSFGRGEVSGLLARPAIIL